MLGDIGAAFIDVQVMDSALSFDRSGILMKNVVAFIVAGVVSVLIQLRDRPVARRTARHLSIHRLSIGSNMVSYRNDQRVCRAALGSDQPIPGDSLRWTSIAWVLGRCCGPRLQLTGWGCYARPGGWGLAGDCAWVPSWKPSGSRGMSFDGKQQAERHGLELQTGNNHQRQCWYLIIRRTVPDPYLLPSILLV